MTLDELELQLKEKGIRHNAVSLRGGISTAAEQYCISKCGSIWEVYYYERGHKNGLQTFIDEDTACRALFDILLKDRTVWKRNANS